MQECAQSHSLFQDYKLCNVHTFIINFINNFILYKEEAMKKKSLAKILTMTMIASIVTSLCPATLYAATGSEVAKEGTYTSTKHVTDEGRTGMERI